MSLPSSIAVNIRWNTVAYRLYSSVRCMAYAVLRADHEVHDRVVPLLSCALDPIRATRALASCLAALASWMEPMPAVPMASAPSRSSSQEPSPQPRSRAAQGPSTHA
eukprot:1652430-Pleurochrysis_carterae.AAC.1